MKKIIILASLTIFTSKIFSQKNWPNYDGKLEITGSIENTDIGGFTTSEKNVSLKAQGAIGNLGGIFGFNKNQRKVNAAICYAQVSKNTNEVAKVWALGPEVTVLTKPNPNKTNYVWVGIAGFFTLAKEGVFRLEASANHNAMLKKNSNDWNQSTSSIEAVGIRKFKLMHRILGIGGRVGYSNIVDNESKPKDNQSAATYLNSIQVSNKIDLGIFANLQLGQFEVNFGPEFNKDQYSYKENGQLKSHGTSEWLRDWWVSIVYNFQHFKK